MDLDSSDTIQTKYFMLTMFNDTIVTIYPHSMLINLEPFVIFAPIPMN